MMQGTMACAAIKPNKSGGESSRMRRTMAQTAVAVLDDVMQLENKGKIIYAVEIPWSRERWLEVRDRGQQGATGCPEGLTSSAVGLQLHFQWRLGGNLAVGSISGVHMVVP